MMTGFALKLLACAFMVTDHVAEFIPGMPVWMHWVGRLAAPIFLFLIGEGVEHTHDKHAYLLRLYIAGLAMSIMQVILGIPNNIFPTLFSVALIIVLLSNDGMLGKLRNISLYLTYQASLSFILPLIASLIPESARNIEYIIVAGTFYAPSLEGRMFWIALGVILWSARRRAMLIVAGLGGSSLLYYLCSRSFMLTVPAYATMLLSSFPNAGASYRNGMAPDFNAPITSLLMGWCQQLDLVYPSSMGQSPFAENYQWMMIFALPLLLLYNGRRGPNTVASKWSFYIFYPAHIIVLFCIGSAFGYSYEPWWSII